MFWTASLKAHPCDGWREFTSEEDLHFPFSKGLNVLKEVVDMKEEIVIVRIFFKIFNVLELLTSLQKRKWYVHVTDFLMTPCSPDPGSAVITWHPNKGLGSLGLLQNHWLLTGLVCAPWRLWREEFPAVRLWEVLHPMLPVWMVMCKTCLCF